MKSILTICILLAAFSCSAQTEKKGDTLVIKDWQAFKFIKIGDKVYQIKSPTITEAPPAFVLPGGVHLLGGWGQGAKVPINYDTSFLKGQIFFKSL